MHFDVDLPTLAALADHYNLNLIPKAKPLQQVKLIH